jgi:hypothetical protein
VREIAALTGIAENHCYEELQALSALGLIVSRRVAGHEGRRLLGLVDPAAPPASWFATAGAIALASEWGAKHLDDGGTHGRLAKQLVEGLGVQRQVPEPGLKRVPEPGVKESRSRDAYQEGQEVQDRGSPRAPHGARKSEERVPTSITSARARWDSVRRGLCRSCEGFLQVSGDGLCEGCWAEECAA